MDIVETLIVCLDQVFEDKLSLGLLVESEKSMRVVPPLLQRSLVINRIPAFVVLLQCYSLLMKS